tara:strand:+ start:54 stop:569 length:516 start_codon:yes stop_codon:yes gene_type:complete
LIPLGKMKKTFILINLFCLVMAQDVLTLKNGQTYEGTLIEITDTSIFFKAKEMKFAQGIPLKLVKSVHNKNGEILFSGDGIPLSVSLKEKAKKKENKTIIVSHSRLLQMGAILIAGSGALGLYNNNRECEDCDIDELRTFSDDTEILTNLQYVMLFFGGICIWADEVIIEQ